ncbi:MAG: zinc-ribbon domain-containing protein [Geminicoccaceae bacterium]|nr:zinc-ribbon domain-containing protein [Geminicoccaceae bacterium]MCS7266978.1 zinc-ribbon domain-containing protein [Geminicoccaceae bacterium]MCX7628796.1 zinc-ribbon domain-containing protein [Geminicoccaceae bacterium]MDW8123401.1 DUF3426 domain-containing protein [Geminicoccaceae bacterium]MDW8341655.1 DUF3426 domain-containing protein [Geminicoccaceae bacterium]
MIVVCPNCGAGFRLDPVHLKPEGRRVRCSACGHRWTIFPEAPEEAGPEGASPAVVATPQPAAGDSVAAPEPPPLATAPALGAPPSGKGAAIVGWLLVLLLLLTLAGLVVGRNEIVAAFPETAVVYERLGLPVTVRFGLEFKNLASKRVEEAGIEIYVVEGEIHNSGGSRQRVPQIRVALLDGERKELDAALFAPQHEILEPGGITRFEARIADPPPTTRTFRVTFAP